MLITTFLLAGLFARATADCCHQGRVLIEVDCKNHFFGSQECKDATSQFITVYDQRMRFKVTIDCLKPTFPWDVDARACADGSDSTDWDRCTDLSRPVPGKDYEGPSGRCDFIGCKCGWECRSGPITEENKRRFCPILDVEEPKTYTWINRRLQSSGEVPEVESSAVNATALNRCVDTVSASNGGSGTFNTSATVTSFFDCLDADDDGAIDLDDPILAGLDIEPAEFKETDSNGNGQIDKTEFDPLISMSRSSPSVVSSLIGLVALIAAVL